MPLKLTWKDETPTGYDLKGLHKKLHSWLAIPTNEHALEDCIQSREATPTCHTRAQSVTCKVWNLAVKTVNWADSMRPSGEMSPNMPKDMRPVLALVEDVKTRAKQETFRGKPGGSVVALTFDAKHVTNKDNNCRFGGTHTVYLIDAGYVNDDRNYPFFVVYDQDVTAREETEREWDKLVERVDDDKKVEEKVDLTTKLYEPKAKTKLKSLIEGSETSKGLMIRFLHVGE